MTNNSLTPGDLLVEIGLLETRPLTSKTYRDQKDSDEDATNQ